MPVAMRTVGPWGKDERATMTGRFNGLGQKLTHTLKQLDNRADKIAAVEREVSNFEKTLECLYSNTAMTELQYMKLDSRLMDLKGAFLDCIQDDKI